MDRAAGAGASRAAAQDHGIAGLQAQRAGIGGHIGAAFEDHADDAERHAHALDGEGSPIAIERVRVPIGVVGVIFESRPNVTADAGALCLKSGKP